MKAFKSGNTTIILIIAAVAALVVVPHAAQARLNKSDTMTSGEASINARRHDDQKLASAKQKKSGQGVRSIPYSTPEAPIPPPSSRKKKSQKKKKTAES